MRRRRVVIRSNAANPFRVSAEGVDANGATTFELLFDGNQQPLRLWGTGYVQMAALRAANMAPAQFAAGRPSMPTPAGTYPLFMVVGRSVADQLLMTAYNRGWSNTLGFWRSGFGGVVTNSLFHAIMFSKQAMIPIEVGQVEQSIPDTYVNYCIFRNYG